MIRKLSTEHLDAVYTAAINNKLESVMIYRNEKGRAKGVLMIDFKIDNKFMPTYLDTALHDIFKAKLLEIRDAYVNNRLAGIDFSYVPNTSRLKTNFDITL